MSFYSCFVFHFSFLVALPLDPAKRALTAIQEMAVPLWIPIVGFPTLVRC